MNDCLVRVEEDLECLILKVGSSSVSLFSWIGRNMGEGGGGRRRVMLITSLSKGCEVGSESRQGNW